MHKVTNGVYRYIGQQNPTIDSADDLNFLTKVYLGVDSKSSKLEPLSMCSMGELSSPAKFILSPYICMAGGNVDPRPFTNQPWLLVSPILHVHAAGSKLGDFFFTYVRNFRSCICIFGKLILIVP